MKKKIQLFISLFCLTSECDAGRYGKNCKKVCGHCIESKKCHHVSGNCSKNVNQGTEGLLAKKVDIYFKRRYQCDTFNNDYNMGYQITLKII